MFQLIILYYYCKGFFRPRLRDAAAVEAWQQRKLRRYLDWLSRASSFYRPYRGQPLDAFPRMDKSELMDHFDTLNTAGIRKEEAMEMALRAEQTRDFSRELGGITVGLSSGTSGNRGLFLASRRERAMWVAEVLRRVLPLRRKRQQIAFFLRSDSRLYASVRSRLIAFHYFDLSAPFDELAKALQSLQADVLVAPPAVLYELARRQEAGEIRIAPHKIISVAEVLEPDIRAVLRRVFGQEIHQVYQATEGFLASTCSHGVLHFHEDLIHIGRQWVDDGRTIFHPVITDFHRRSLPIVRYELNDRVHLRPTPCPCGSPFTAIDHIEGRSDDVLRFRAADGAEAMIFPDFIRYAILLASGDVRNFRVIQTKADEVQVQLEVLPDIAEEVALAVRSSLEALFTKNGVVGLVIHILPFEELGYMEKFRRVKYLKTIV